jgi:hypothetical protein
MFATEQTKVRHITVSRVWCSLAAPTTVKLTFPRRRRRARTRPGQQPPRTDLAGA